MKKHLKMKVDGGRLRWTGHVPRTCEERAKRKRETEERGRRRNRRAW